MKIINKIKNYFLLPVLLVVGLASCKKDDNGEVKGGKGAPTITRIRTVSRSSRDTVNQTYITYNSDGSTSTSSAILVYPNNMTPLDSTTTTGNLGNYYAIQGTNLASTTKITLNGVSIYFNKAEASDNSLIFTIPSTTPYVQPQSNTLVLTNLYGSVTYNFTVLPPAPTINAASDYNFVQGTQITLKGQGFSAVTAVSVGKGGNAATIGAKTDTTLVLTMPTSNLTSAPLIFTYTSGSKSVQAASAQQFVDVDNNYVIFDDNYKNSWGDNSWSHPSGTATTAAHRGSASFQLNYPAGGWQVEGLSNSTGLAYSADYKYLSFWIKGGKAAHTLVLVGDGIKGGWGQTQNTSAYAAQLVAVPANVWTYVKIPLATTGANVANSNPAALALWETGSTLKSLGLFLQGQSGDVDESMYIDDVVLIK